MGCRNVCISYTNCLTVGQHRLSVMGYSFKCLLVNIQEVAILSMYSIQVIDSCIYSYMLVGQLLFRIRFLFQSLSIRRSFQYPSVPLRLS